KEQSDQFLNVIKSSAQFLLSLINDLLELQRIQSDAEDMEMQPLVLCDVVRTSVNALQYMASLKNIDLELVDHTPEGAKISGDANSLLRITNNLLSNAIKFTPKDGQIKLMIEPHNDREIALSVIDSGVGVPEEKIPHLFDKFSKTSQSGTEGEKGSGLGLSITKELVAKHGGTIEVSSRAGEGSTFTALFPILSNGQASPER
ncbi:MAG: sensor histidine kinase, partial [Nitrospinales bacterium]